MTEKAEIFQHVRTTLIRLFELPEQAITPEARLQEDLDIDSIDTVDLVVELTPYVGRKFRPEDFNSVRTVEDLVDALDAMMNGD